MSVAGICEQRERWESDISRTGSGRVYEKGFEVSSQCDEKPVVGFSA